MREIKNERSDKRESEKMRKIEIQNLGKNTERRRKNKRKKQKQ